MKKVLYNVVYYFSLDEKVSHVYSETYFVYAHSPCVAVQKVLCKIVNDYHPDVIYHVHSHVEPVLNFLK